MILRTYRNMTEGALEAFVNKVNERCATDPQFASLTDNTITELTQAIQDYELALSKLPGSPAQTLEKNERKEELFKVLDKLVLQIELLAQGNKQLILDAGFNYRKVREFTTVVLEKPVINKIVNGIKSGDVNINWNPIHGAVTYAIEQSIDEGSTWTNGTYCTGSRIKLTGYQAGTRVQFRIKAIGRGNSNKSEAAETALWIA